MSADQGWYTEPATRTIGALLARAQEVEDATGLKPTAYIAPGNFLPGVTALYGIPVLRADRTALVYDVEVPQ